MAEALSYSALPEFVSRFAEQDRRERFSLQKKEFTKSGKDKFLEKARERLW
jgi:hypothetical protein